MDRQTRRFLHFYLPLVFVLEIHVHQRQLCLLVVLRFYIATASLNVVALLALSKEGLGERAPVVVIGNRGFD